MSNTLIAEYILPRYTGYSSPDYPVTLLDDSGNAINLTSETSHSFTVVLQNISNAQFQTGNGSWTITDAANGKASYRFGSNDLANAGMYLFYVTVQLLGESSPRVFNPIVIEITFLPGGSALVTTQDVNLIQVSGSAVNSGNPVPIAGPVTTIDGGNVSQGAKADAAITDPSLSASEIALLKGLMTIIKNGQKLLDSGGANQASISSGGALKVDNSAVTQPVSGNVTEANSSSINTHLGNIDTDSASIVTNTSNTATHAANIDTHTPALGQAAMAASTPVVIASNQSNVPTSLQAVASGLSNANPVPILDTAQPGYIAAYGSNGAATAATTDYAFKWGASGTTQVNHVMINNNTGADVKWEADTTANAGSPVLATGQTLFIDVQMTALHLYTAGIQNVNGSSGSNIVVRAWN